MYFPLPDLNEFVQTIRSDHIFPALIYLVSGFIAASFLGRLSFKAAVKHASAHHSLLFRRVVYYLTLIIFLVLTFRELGWEVKAILGAAGIGAAAIAFASQTGISNVISGMFLLIEKPFVVGDLIVAGGVSGEILSIDLLSINIRTRDNTLVRIPNELLLKSQFQNISRFPLRRLDLRFRFHFDVDIEQVKEILYKIAERDPLCLETPAPDFFFVEFGAGGIIIQFSCWVKQDSFHDLKTSLQIAIQKAFVDQDIKIPYLYTQNPNAAPLITSGAEPGSS